MENVVIDGNEYAVRTFEDSDEGGQLQNGIQLTIEQDNKGKQRALSMGDSELESTSSVWKKRRGNSIWRV